VAVGTTQKSLYFLGDSHILVPQRAFDMGLFGGVECFFASVGGATAVGLRHPTSRTQALVHFRKCLLPYNRKYLPVFQLGEVDTGFLSWLRAQEYGESVHHQIDQSIIAYRNFLREMKNAGYDDLIVTSATPPTIRDGDSRGEVHYLRREVRATYRERSDLTASYNRSLAAACVQEEFTFVDFTPDFVDPATGLLNEYFRSDNPCDHHLDRERAGQVWAKRILDHLLTCTKVA
jgi:hypothetical protein